MRIIFFSTLFACAFVYLSESANIDRQAKCTDCKWSEHWELVTRLNVGDFIPLYKYRSKRTGMTIALAAAESPIVNGFFCLATQAFTNDGLPHTLEHLIFRGR